ncbi:unnamed protein product, partial [Rotaria magnacalcarata]
VNIKSLETSTNTIYEVDLTEKAIPYTDPKFQEKIILIERKSTTNSLLFHAANYLKNNYNQRQKMNDVIKIITISLLTFILLVLLCSIMFGIFICIRLILFGSVDRVGMWSTLVEESAV